MVLQRKGGGSGKLKGVDRGQVMRWKTHVGAEREECV